MKKMLAVLSGLALAGALAIGAASPAAADTFVGPNCERFDVQVTDGTTVVLFYGPDCPYRGYNIRTGSPTVVYQPSQGYSSFTWHQAVGRPDAAAVCEEGWTPSWAQWVGDGQGGYTCERELEWAISKGGGADALFITINSDIDFVNGLSDGKYVFGCSYGNQGWDIVGNCL